MWNSRLADLFPALGQGFDQSRHFRQCGIVIAGIGLGQAQDAIAVQAVQIRGELSALLQIQGALESHFEDAETQFLFSPLQRPDGFLKVPARFSPPDGRLALAEIPVDFMKLKSEDATLARDWRFFSREVFETTFKTGYLITDFVYDRNSNRSFYVLVDGESTLGKVL